MSEHGNLLTEDPTPAEALGRDDPEGSYAAHMAAREAASLLDEARARIKAGRTEAPADEAASEDTDLPSETERDPRGRAGFRLRPGAEGEVEPPDPTKPGAVEEATVRWLLDKLQIGIDLPRAIGGGIRDAAQETLESMDALAVWLNDNVADLTIEGADTEAKFNLPEVEPNRTATGAVVRGIAQFLAGFVGGGKALKGLGMATAKTGAGKAAQAGTKGAIADFAAFDPDDGRLVDLLEGHPELKEIVPAFLESDPTDSEAEKRLKRALEGLGAGAVVDGFVLGLRALRARRRLKAEAAAPDAGDPLADARARYGEVSDEDLAILGDPADDLVSVRKMEAAEAATAATAPGRLARPGWDDLKNIDPNDSRVFDITPQGRFLKGADGSADLGAAPAIDAAGNRFGEAPVRLRRQDARHVDSGARHENAVELGYRNGIELAEDVAGNWTELRRSRTRPDRLLLVKRNGANSVAVIELAPDAETGFYRIVTAGKRSDGQLGDVLETRERTPGPGAGDPASLARRPEDVAGGPDPAIAGSSGAEIGPRGGEIKINFSRINTSDDVKALIRRTVDLFAGDIDAARRGVRSNEATKEAADALGMTVDDVLSRRGGQPLNAEESLAARRLWAASAEKLMQAAERAAGPNAGEVDQFVFRKALSIHYAIQAEVIGARTETARALQAWSIPAEGVDRARAIQNLIEDSGGAPVSQALAGRIAALRRAGVTGPGLSVAVRRGAFARTLSAVRESFVLGLLWSPPTHLVNMGSNTIVAFQQIAERGAAAQWAQLIGREAAEGGVIPGEGLAMAYGMITGIKDMFRAGGRTLITGVQAQQLGKVDLPQPAITAEAFNLDPMGPLGQAVDFYGFLTRFSGDLMGGEDAVFKTVGYRMEVHSRALRQAAQEGHKGIDLARRMQEIANDPPADIRLAAADAALYNTFTNKPGEWASQIMRLRNVGSLNPTFVVLPFVRTPANILRYGFERTALAPLVGQWRADIAAGGARADIAAARMGLGSLVMATFADYAYSGYISGNGPNDPGRRGALQRQGWRRNAVWKSDGAGGGTWISYNRLDPFGNAANFAAVMSEILKTRDVSPEDMDEISELMAMATAAVSSSVIDKSYFEGVSRVFHAMDEPDRFLPSYMERTLASFVPFTTALNTVRREMDPSLRDANGVWQQIMARLPGLSDRLPLALDLWGFERGPDQVYGRAFDVLSPLYATAWKDSPVDAEITRLGIGIRRIPKKASIKGIDINFRDWPRVYEEYVRLAGSGLKHPAWQLGARDYLDQVVTGKHPMAEIYNIGSDGPEGGKAVFIRDAVSEYRRLAQDALLADPRFHRFVEHFEQKRNEQSEARLPAPLQNAPAAAPPPAPDNGGAGNPPTLR